MSPFSNKLCWRSNEFCHAKGNYNNKTDIAWNSGELILLFCYKLIIKTHFLFENLVFESSHWWTAEGQQCSTKMKRSEIYLLNQYLLQAGDNYIFSIELFYWLNTTVIIIITFNFPVAFKYPTKRFLSEALKLPFPPPGGGGYSLRVCFSGFLLRVSNLSFFVLIRVSIYQFLS